MRMRLQTGIGARVFAFLFVCLILGSAVGVWAIGRYQKVASEISNDMARRSSDLAESLKVQVIRNAYMTLSAMSGFQRVQGKNPSDCTDVATFFLKNTIGYINVGSVLPDGTIYCAAQPATIGMNVKDQDWFKSALANGQFSIGGIQKSNVIHSNIMTFGLPIKNEKGNVTQVLGLTTEIKYIAQVLAFPHLPDGTSLTVIDQYGNVLISNSNTQRKIGTSIADWEVAKRAMTADEPFVMNWKGDDGLDRVYAITSSRVSDDAVPSANQADIRAFSIIVGIPARSIALSIMGPVQSAGIAIGLMFLLILIGIYFFVGRTLVKPIREIQSMAERLTFGDLTARITSKSRAGEVRSLANAFNTMAATLAKREDDIRASNIRFQRIFETEPAGVALLDHELKVIDINQAGLEILGADDIDQIRGHTMPTLVIEEDYEKFRRHLHTVRGGKTDLVSFQIVDLKGKRRWQRMQSATIKFADDTPTGFISIVRDTTDEVATEAQLVQAQKMESIGRLTGGVAHDFNNLLTIVMGNAEILIEELEERPKLQKLATMIEAAAQRGAELTHRMLAFARRQVLRPTQLDTNVLLNRIVDMMGHLLGEDIQVRIEASEGLWSIAADPAQMESAILNLAINARDAMPKGGALTIETKNVTLDKDYASLNPDVTPGDYVQIAVSDSGIGMSPDVLNHVFDPFFTTKEVGKGSGLGLSMVYGFVKQSSGHIKIYSEVGQGTSIRIYLPRIGGDGTIATIETEVTIKDTRGNETILVTEDAESVRDYVTQQLESLGYTVVEASDAEEALSIMESRSDIDLLFTDVVLPGGINGRQLAEIALNKYPTLKVLYTTGYTENAVVHHGKLDAGVELLSKPYRREELARHVRIVLDKP